MHSSAIPVGGPVAGLYVHIPFCQYRCTYCDFATFADQDHQIDDYLGALGAEIALRCAGLPHRPAETVFFGGGTPSRLAPAQVAHVLRRLRDVFILPDDAEVTLEANPGTLDAERMRALRSLGVTRLSIGVQSLNDDILRRLNRIHDAAQALAAIEMARRVDFASVNADLIFGLPGQDLADWQATLRGVLAAAPDHLSVYGLIVEPGTPLRRQLRSGNVRLPDDDQTAQMYEWTRETLATHGYEHYEISNWARPGHRCRHNLIYWQHEQYLGVGLSAHSYVNGERFANVRGLQGYITRLHGGRLPTAHAERIDAARARSDAAILGLRLVEGIHLPTFDARFGGTLASDRADAIDRLGGAGLLEVVGEHLRLTGRGYLLANQVWQEFL